jgi:hypothetical protein
MEENEVTLLVSNVHCIVAVLNIISQIRLRRTFQVKGSGEITSASYSYR